MMTRWLQLCICAVLISLALVLLHARHWGERYIPATHAATVNDTVASLMASANEDWIRQHPDEFSWKILAAISRPVTAADPFMPADCWQGQEVHDYAEWETWADDDFLFPKKVDTSAPPQWSARHCQKDDLIPDPLNVSASRPAVKAMGMEERLMPPVPPAGAPDGVEEIRHNYYDVQWIVDTKMWYQQGLAAVFASGFDADHIPNVIDAHADLHPEDRYAVEIKAEWVRISEDKKPQYHWNYSYAANGQKTLWGLEALHIMTRGLKTWTWSTFENIHGNGQCDFYGCKDNYGCSDKQGYCPTDIPPADPYQLPYPTLGLSLSDEVQQLLQGYGEWTDWKNYRLKGTQIDYDSPTLLANSKIEAQVMNDPPTSSCISCHAATRADKNGQVACDRGFLTNKPGNNLNVSLHGKPVEYRRNGLDTKGFGPMGFIWSVMNAHDQNGNPVCPQPAPIQ